MEISGVGGFGWQNPVREKDERQKVPGNNVSLLGGTAAIDAPKKEPETTNPGPVQDFKDYMAKTPEQRMQDAWLQSHGITPEEYAAMSPEEKNRIAEMMRRELEDKIKETAATGQKRVDILA